MSLEDTIKTVAVHNERFHADDAFAIAALRLIYPEFEVIRTRDRKIMDSADMRVDVGMEYDHSKKTYDHHQNEGAGTREDGTPYASFGLIWKHYGMEICGSEKIVDEIDRIIVKKIDAIDTNYSSNYKDYDKYFSLSQVIAYMNPSWQDEGANYDSEFGKAVDFAKILLGNVIKEVKGRFIAEDIVRNGINRNKGEPYIILEKECPWYKVAIEESAAEYVIHPTKNSDWRVEGIPINTGTKACRKYFPNTWAGLENEELARISGVPEATFCHKNLFMVRATTLEGAKKIAEIASRYE